MHKNLQSTNKKQKKYGFGYDWIAHLFIYLKKYLTKIYTRAHTHFF